MFINGQTCCNQDSVISSSGPCNALVIANQNLYGLNYPQQTPFCPPIIFFQCYYNPSLGYSLTDQYCNQVSWVAWAQEYACSYC